MDVKKKVVTIVTPCFNESANVHEIYSEVKNVFLDFPQYEYHHLFIDNCSNDGTAECLRKIANEDKRVQVIINAKNFGVIRSNYYALCEAKGDAVINLVADGQDPTSLIREFLKQWEAGYYIVVGVKSKSAGFIFMRLLRFLYYRILAIVAEVPPIKDFTGFGLYDRKVIDIFKGYAHPYPYFRGMIGELGYPIAEIHYNQPERYHGKSSTSFRWLYHYAMLGLTSSSIAPLRFPFWISIFSFFVWALLWFIPMPIEKMIPFLFLYQIIILFFIGIIGEYLATLHYLLSKKPLVIEKERINF